MPGPFLCTFGMRLPHCRFGNFCSALLKASLLALSNLPVSALIVAAFDSKQQKKVKIMIKADFMISSRGIVKIVYNFNMT